MDNLKGKNILIGITGSIAAYKAAYLIRLFKKEGAFVKVVATDAALLFIGEKTLETLSQNPVYIDTFEKRNSTEHISLADWADAFVIAPASANTLSKISNGIADNLLTSVACAYLGKNKPFFTAPCMNTSMWQNSIVQENIKKLKNCAVSVINPTEGELACGYTGEGRMEEPCNILNFINSSFIQKKGKKIIVTAGGTKEYIDPVRFITNASSGKMGIALADCAHEMGYEVVLIASFEAKKPYKTLLAETANEMFDCIKKEFIDADYLFMAAAVADFKPAEKMPSKILKSNIKNNSYTIELKLNPDILKSVAETKKNSQKVIGFSLTTENTLEIAKEKLKTKNCDFIIANEAKTALNNDTNEVWVIDTANKVTKIEKAKKTAVARSILEIVL